MQVVLNYLTNILKVFHKAYKSTASYIYIITGRSAGKSKFVPEKLFYDFLKVPNGNVMVFRKNQNTILRSSFEAIRKVIFKYNMQDDFDFIESRLIIEDLTNGSRFYFFGLDDENKIRSTEMKSGFPFRYWFEEFQENKTLAHLEQIEDLLSTFFREKLPNGLKHQAIFTGNRPRNPHKPFNVYIDKKKQYAHEDDAVFIYSDYELMKDNVTGEWLLSQQELDRIERVRERDFKTFQWRYKGLAIGDDTQIYNMDLIKKIKSINDLPKGEFIMNFDVVIDTGYQISATTFGAIGITNKLNPVILGTYYFSPDINIEKRIPEYILEPHGVAQTLGEKKAPSEYAVDLYEFRRFIAEKYDLYIDEMYIDSAEGALRTQFFKEYGEFIRTVVKKEKDEMIEDSRIVLVERQLYVIDEPENEIFWFEMEKYQRNMDNPEKPKIIKVDDHCADWWQYWCVMNLNKIGLR